MKIAHLAAGAGAGYCGACARDAALVRGLRAAGHDAIMLALYTPLQVEGPDPSERPVFFGGVNVWLQQKSALFRHTPRWFDRVLDSRRFLNWVMRFAVQTRPEDLGPMTVSVLRGDQGCQRKEMDRLIRYLAQFRPDVVSITNSLLSGAAPALKQRLGVRVVCSLQGEESFVQRLGSPWRDQALALLRDHARSVDQFWAPHASYAAEMCALLLTPAHRFRVVPPGIDATPFDGPASRPGGGLRIGFLSRRSPAKGLDILCEAFVLLDRLAPGRARLAVSGQAQGPDARFWRQQMRRLAQARLADRVEDLGETDLDAKSAMLRGIHVFCLPSRYPERRGIAALEALAAGAVVVAPPQGIFPDLASATGAVVLAPAEPAPLARALAGLAADPGRLAALARAAAQGVRASFTSAHMTQAAIAALETLAPPPSA